MGPIWPLEDAKALKWRELRHSKEDLQMVGIGIVGVGFMGMIHYLAAQKIKNGRVAAICTRDAKKLAGDWTGIQGNFGPRGTMMDLSGINRHSRFEDLLADPDVALVDLCVPNDDHARLAIAALEAGKDVLVEKPIALTLADADAMLAAAEKSGRKLMVAHILPFFPEFEFVREAVASGKYGKLLAAHFTRVISKPDWSSGIAEDARSGGPAIDLHIHDTHFVDLVCGTPRGVHSIGVHDGGAVRHLSTQYLYGPGGPAVSAISGALCQAGRPFSHGYDVVLEQATITFGFESPVAVFGPDGGVERPELGGGDPIDAFARELEEAASAVAEGRESAMLSGARARRALALSLAEVQSVLNGGEAAIG